MARGTVKFFDADKGYGFIIKNDTNKQYFVHITDVHDKVPLEKGQNVFFDPTESKKGPKALNVDIDIIKRT